MQPCNHVTMGSYRVQAPPAVSDNVALCRIMRRGRDGPLGPSADPACGTAQCPYPRASSIEHRSSCPWPFSILYPPSSLALKGCCTWLQLVAPSCSYQEKN